MSEAKTAPIWKGEFGDQYVERNEGKVASNTAMFAKILQRTNSITSVLEFGCGTGQNLEAIQNLIGPVDLYGIEINVEASNFAENVTSDISCRDYIAENTPGHWPETFDLTMTKGVLIHTAPADLPTAYDRLIEHSSKYILIAEYYNPTPVEVMYRGMPAALWKRDFCKEIIQQAWIVHGQRLQLIDYGFQYHGDHNFPQDDITWFLMEKVK